MPPFKQIGKLPPVFGRYRLARSGQALALRSAQTTFEKTARKKYLETRGLAALTIIPSPAAVIVETKDLPLEVKSPFLLAGGRFVNDLERYCQYVVFIRNLETTQGERAQGFEISNSGAGIKELLELSNSIELPAGILPQIMFLNLTNEDGKTIDGAKLHLTMSWLLGRMMVTPLLREMNFTPETLGAESRDHFAYSYQLRMTTEFVSFLAQKKGYADSQDRVYYEEEIRKIASSLRRLHNIIPPEEQDTLRTLIDQQS